MPVLKDRQSAASLHIVVAHSQLNSLGGGERSVLALLKFLSERHEVTLWAGHYVAEWTYADFAHFPRYDVSPSGWLWRTPRADAVVTHSFGAHLLALRHPRTLCYIHTLRSIYLRGGLSPTLAARGKLDNAAMRRAVAVATNSAYTATQAQQRYERTIEIVPPGAEDTFFHVAPQAGDYALYVGRLSPEKGVERLLRWHGDLPFDLAIVGTGDRRYVDHLRSLAGMRARFLGPLNGDALYAAYAGCRFLAFLPHQEEFGLAALEAMAAAKPVVAVREGGLIELIGPERTGLFVSSAEEYQSAARRLFESDALALRLGAAGRVKAQRFTWEQYAQRIEALCEAHIQLR